jgi:hydroxymethylpyrimidine/phosphomethylpyrimidine kinase
MTYAPLPCVLVFAGHDPSGGAGIQADIQTLSALACHPVSIMTCITVQDSANVHALYPLPADQVREQAKAVLADMPIAAVKIGLLGSVEIIGVVANIVRQLSSSTANLPIVLDPVLAAGGGAELSSSDIRNAILSQLAPLTTLITPNSVEARRLAGDAVASLSQAADYLQRAGCQNTLITGAHEETQDVINHLYMANGEQRCQNWPRFANSYHGSGCTLASAISAHLAHGETVGEAVKKGQAYTWQSLRQAFLPGRGQWIPRRV